MYQPLCHGEGVERCVTGDGVGVRADIFTTRIEAAPTCRSVRRPGRQLDASTVISQRIGGSCPHLVSVRPFPHDWGYAGKRCL